MGQPEPNYAQLMKLPPGKTCADCKHGPHCEALFSAVSHKFTSCDFYPSRYTEATPMPKLDLAARREQAIVDCDADTIILLDRIERLQTDMRAIEVAATARVRRGHQPSAEQQLVLLGAIALSAKRALKETQNAG